MNAKGLLTIAGLLVLTSTALASDNIAGIWQTEKGKNGGYLHVEFDTCDDEVCAAIVAAFNDQNERGHDYKHLGKFMVWGMHSAGDNRWNGGHIWDPTTNKTYKSKMRLRDNSLKVSGCIAFFCRSQSWTRLK